MSGTSEFSQSAHLVPQDLGIGILFERVPDAVVVADSATDRIILWNPSAAKMLGYSAEEAIGRAVSMIVPERYQAAHRQGMERFRATGHGRYIDSHTPFEMPAVCRDGHELPIEMTLSPLDSLVPGKRLVIAVLRDMSERRAAAEAIAQQSELLRRQNEELKSLDRLKDEFISVVSHELRTPVNAITGFGSILADGVAGQLTPQQSAYVERILEGADRLLALVDDLLDYSRIQAGKLKLDVMRVDLRAPIRGALDLMAEQAHHKGLVLEAALPPEPLWADADARRVGQVLINLLNNAIKFTPPGGHVAVSVAREDTRYVVRVCDNGPGIARADQSRLFQRFGQLDTSNTRQSKGTGLGLAIVKNLVMAHGGEVGVESDEGKGACFWFSLPVPASEP
ncbi:MAG TPA: PAS domain-containing sensor histidine kinase [Oscillatoriaceae cyanobacterium]